ncbi:MurR/RpiR family transcriptional regulator [Simiduia sp. 21SJ11W-1]|uniref:MurR/RpiR family transcriptional regulator n=1 Tax=Simiduia sp. 21SJ11W-1 TaxID=2909669 RepID=UPI00209FFBC0|nr:MurR/RpiR family transcriptional regulator [Simiduia sp. 21SJ11W-1]UTA48402.1 MurR/RpiR family transcriptional regulator [Simiduia sp. 21SJ11W-1]
MSCLLKMRAMRDEMSVNERKLADFILGNTPLLRDYSSQQLADAVGVSQSSVVKFSQKLGYKGYPSLKLAVYETYAANNSADATPGNGFSDTGLPLSELGQKKLEALENTVRINDAGQIQKAVAAVRSARCIQVAACAGSASVARYLTMQLLELGYWVVFDSDITLQKRVAANIEERDVLCIVCDMGREEPLIDVARKARERGAQVLSLTRYHHNAISMHADINLFVMPAEDERVLQNLLFRSAQLHLVESLVAGLLLEAERPA